MPARIGSQPSWILPGAFCVELVPTLPSNEIDDLCFAVYDETFWFHPGVDVLGPAGVQPRRMLERAAARGGAFGRAVCGCVRSERRWAAVDHIRTGALQSCRRTD